MHELTHERRKWLSIHFDTILVKSPGKANFRAQPCLAFTLAVVKFITMTPRLYQSFLFLSPIEDVVHHLQTDVIENEDRLQKLPLDFAKHTA